MNRIYYFYILKSLLDMQKYKGWFTLIGFVLVILGFLSIVLNMVGLELSLLTILDVFGGLTAFVLKIFMILSGIIIITLARTDWNKLESEEEEKV